MNTAPALSNTISSLTSRVAVEMLDARKSVWGGRISCRDNKNGTFTSTYKQDGEVIGTGIGASKDGALIALAHSVEACA